MRSICHAGLRKRPGSGFVLPIPARASGRSVQACPALCSVNATEWAAGGRAGRVGVASARTAVQASTLSASSVSSFASTGDATKSASSLLPCQAATSGGDAGLQEDQVARKGLIVVVERGKAVRSYAALSPVSIVSSSLVKKDDGASAMTLGRNHRSAPFRHINEVGSTPF
ncbi:hypothetical protein BJ546DRAFT_291279 [Cryomyces antarcticus]